MHDERNFLLAELGNQRQHLLKTMADLDDGFLLAKGLPSRWAPAGLIHHLTHDVERFWFRMVLMNEPNALLTPAGAEAWDVPEGKSVADILAEYQDEAAYNDGLVANMDLDTAPLWWDDDLFGHSGPANLREILLHVIVETATHAGHMDIVRELHDGAQHLVLTDESRPGR